MSYRSDSTPYSCVRIALHWISAVVIIWAIFTGFLFASRSVDDPVRQAIDVINPQLTALFVPFFVIRLALYLRNRPWRKWSGDTLQGRLATAGHAMLYVCVTLVLVTGFLMMPESWNLLGAIPVPALIRNTAELSELRNLHGIVSGCLAVLIGGHLAAVVKHHFHDNPVLSRMICPSAMSSRQHKQPTTA